MKKVVGTMNKKFMMKYAHPNWLSVPIRIQNGKCHVADKSPNIKLEIKGVNLLCREGNATPRQPISSPNAAIKRNIIFGINTPSEIGNRLIADGALNAL